MFSKVEEHGLIAVLGRKTLRAPNVCQGFCLCSFLVPKWRKNLKKAKENSPISEEMGCFLVRRKGLEPPTYWFVASHSIQLSYRRISA